MKTNLLLFFAIAILIAGCKNAQSAKATPTAPPVDLTYEFPMLDSADIFDGYKSERWHPSPDAVVYARKVYLNAIDRYANHKDVAGSLPLFVRALRVAPEPVIYLRYGQALFENKEYEKACIVSMLVLHDSTLTADATMLTARSGIHVQDGGYRDLFYENLAYALSSGKFDAQEVAAYSDFDSIRDSEYFKLLIAKYDFTNEQRKRALLGLFTKNFRQQLLPFELSADSLRAEGSYREIDYMFDDLIPELGGLNAAFSRNPEQTFQYVARLPDRHGFHTFVYRSINYIAVMMDSVVLPPYSYYLMTVDTSGQNIDKIDLACACSPLNIKTASIDTSGLITIHAIRQTYKYNPIDSGYERNPVVNQESTGEKYYRIMPDGKITATEAKPL